MLLLFLACKKKEVVKEEDRFKEHTEELSELKPEISAVGQTTIEVGWKPVSSTHFKNVNYSLYLDGKKIVDGLNTFKYSFINLNPGQEYSIKMVASTPEGKAVDNNINAKTLPLTEQETPPTIYKEYSIHNYSRMMGTTGLLKLEDGGHLVARFLAHPELFDRESMKLIIFRTGKAGNILWYRLVPTTAYELLSESEILLTLTNNAREGLVFTGRMAFKIDLTSSEILLVKDFRTALRYSSFSAIDNSSTQIIAGTINGDLLAINPNTLQTIWHRPNTDRTGNVIALCLDSKKNIYYAFWDHADYSAQIRVQKRNATGTALADFVFDGEMPDEHHNGFMMTDLVVDEKDNLYLFGHTSDHPYLRFYKFRTDGTVIKRNEKTINFPAKQAFFNDRGEIVAVTTMDDVGLFNRYTGVMVFDKDMNIKSTRFYTEIPRHQLRGVTHNPDGSLNIFLNYMTTYTYDNTNFVFIQTDVNGNI